LIVPWIDNSIFLLERGISGRSGQDLFLIIWRLPDAEQSGGPAAFRVSPQKTARAHYSCLPGNTGTGATTEPESTEERVGKRPPVPLETRKTGETIGMIPAGNGTDDHIPGV
jgi:hypothetical protein